MIDGCGAIISECGLYRYMLWRDWGGDARVCTFIMLNPSTADATQDDPTIRRCIGFATREGCGRLLVLNLFAFRSPSPSALKAAADPIGPDNNRHLGNLVTDGIFGPIIAAWGAHGSHMGRDRVVRGLFSERPLMCLGTTKDGAPRHPLYVKADQPLTVFA